MLGIIYEVDTGVHSCKSTFGKLESIGKRHGDHGKKFTYKVSQHSCLLHTINPSSQYHERVSAAVPRIHAHRLKSLKKIVIALSFLSV
jgi:hypothetical protein